MGRRRTLALGVVALAAAGAALVASLRTPRPDLPSASLERAPDAHAPAPSSGVALGRPRAPARATAATPTPTVPASPDGTALLADAWVPRVEVRPPQVRLRARLDAGFDATLLDCRDHVAHVQGPSSAPRDAEGVISFDVVGAPGPALLVVVARSATEVRLGLREVDVPVEGTLDAGEVVPGGEPTVHVLVRSEAAVADGTMASLLLVGTVAEGKVLQVRAEVPLGRPVAVRGVPAVELALVASMDARRPEGPMRPAVGTWAPSDGARRVELVLAPDRRGPPPPAAALSLSLPPHPTSDGAALRVHTVVLDGPRVTLAGGLGTVGRTATATSVEVPGGRLDAEVLALADGWVAGPRRVVLTAGPVAATLDGWRRATTVRVRTAEAGRAPSSWAPRVRVDVRRGAAAPDTEPPYASADADADGVATLTVLPGEACRVVAWQPSTFVSGRIPRAERAVPADEAGPGATLDLLLVPR
ncbi:MAG: hypothetical protein IT460_14400 [Planctomycetes bacterium]|nr:hypothetical protein [Planctomycetota bacterium]